MKITKRTKEFLETGLADKEAGDEIVQALEDSSSSSGGSGGGSSAAVATLTASLTQTQTDLSNLSLVVAGLQTSKITVHHEIPTIYQIAQNPTLVVYAGAGVGASANFIGAVTNNAGRILLNTGSSGLAAGLILQFVADIPAGNDAAIVTITPNSDLTAAIATSIYVVPNIQGTWQIYSTAPLAPNTTYMWSFIEICVK